MKKREGLWIAIVLIASLIGATCFSYAEQKKEETTEEEKQVVLNIKQERENDYKDYFVPLIPLISVIFASLGGGVINYFYWKKREDVARKNKIFEERIRSYLDLCKHLFEFNACCDHIMRAEDEQRELREKKKPSKEEKSRLEQLLKAVLDYEMKQLEALKGLSQEINYAKIFFEDEVYKKIREYLELYEKVRTKEIEWGPGAFDKLLIAGKGLQSSMEKELKKQISLTLKN